MTLYHHFDCELSVKSLSAQGEFSGYASVFNVVDSHNDMIASGAFAKSLKQKEQGKAVKLLWQHHADEPIGFLKTMREDTRGLYVEAQLSMEVQRAREAYSLLKSGAVEGLSIGYNAVKHNIDATTGVRILNEVDLWEISLVTFPANQAAQVTMVKECGDRGELARLGQEIDRAIDIAS